LYAGTGGFDLTVKGNTDLTGAVITSAAEAAKNRLVTGTLTTADIHNEAAFESNTSSLSLSYTGGGTTTKGGPGGYTYTPPGSQIGQTKAIAPGTATQALSNNLANNVAANAVPGQDGKASGVTRSAISDGTIVLTDEAGQLEKTGQTAAETLASLNRDVKTANGSIEKIFDLKEIEREQEYRKVMSEVAQQAAPIIYKQIGDLAKSKTKPYDDAKRLKEEALFKLGLESDPAKRLQLQQVVADATDVMSQHQAQYELWKEGGAYKVALHGLAGAGLTKLAGGNALAGAAAGAVNEMKAAVLEELLTDLSKDQQKLVNELASLATGAGIGGKQAAVFTLMAEQYNRQLHQTDKRRAKTLYEQAKKAGLPYTVEQIESALRYAGVKDANGKVLIAPGHTEQYALKNDGQVSHLNRPSEGWMPYGSVYAQDPGMTVEARPGAQLVLQEVLPANAPDTQLVRFIVEGTGGASSPYMFATSKEVTVTVPSIYKAAPAGTTRTTVMVDGAAYFPLVANCPAVSCTNSSPIAAGIEDEGTKAYLAALDEKMYRDGVFGLLGLINPGVRGWGLVPRAGGAVEGTALREGASIGGSRTVAGEAGASRSVSAGTASYAEVERALAKGIGANTIDESAAITNASKTAIQTYWPPTGGFFKTPVPETLGEGYRFSRYGGFFDESGTFKDFGSFVAPENVPYGMRALPPGTNMKPLSTYEVVKPIPDVPSGPAAPYFGELGLGKQHQLPMTIQDYLDQGYIRLLNRDVPKNP
jgi:hypothetical protein